MIKQMQALRLGRKVSYHVVLNIASLRKHFDELRVLLSDNPLDILSTNETRLMILSVTTRFKLPVMISFTAIMNITVDLVGEFASMFHLTQISLYGLV